MTEADGSSSASGSSPRTHSGRATVAAILMVVAIAPLASLSTLRSHAWLTITCTLLASIPYALLVYLAYRGEGSLRGMVVLGLVARVLLLIPTEGMSDDLYRYVWEGRLVVAGENPYLHPPDDPSLATYRDDRIWPHVTHREVPAAYPPVAQFFFAAVAAVGGATFAMRVALTLVDLLIWWLLIGWLKQRRLDPIRSVIWGMSPLVWIEVAGSGHFDVLAVAACVMALRWAASDRPLLAASLLGVATVCKPYAPVLLPILWTRRWWFSQSLLFVVAIGLAYAPFAGEGLPFGGLTRYSLQWTHNASFYPVAYGLAEDFKGGLAGCLEWLEASEGVRGIAYGIDPNRLARIGLVASLGLVVLWLARSRRTLEEKSALALGAFLFAAPTVHPWYLLWFVPSLAIAWSTPLFLWSLTVPISYHVLPLYDRTGVWEEVELYRVAEYAPVFAWFFVAFWTRRVRAPRTNAA